MYDDIWDYEHEDGSIDREKEEENGNREAENTENASMEHRTMQDPMETENEMSGSVKHMDNENRNSTPMDTHREDSHMSGTDRNENDAKSNRMNQNRNAVGDAMDHNNMDNNINNSMNNANRNNGGNMDPMYDDAYDDPFRDVQNQSHRIDRSYIPEEPNRGKGKHPKKKGSMAAKIAGITAGAVLFGSVAGVTMFSVNLATGKLAKVLYPTVQQSETVADADDSTAAASVISTAANLDVSAIVKEAMPSVVAITNTQIFQSNNFFFGPSQYEGQSSGSGIIIGQNDAELLIVTNNHVVESSTALKVTFIDNNTVDAAIKGTDSESDLAVIAIQKKDIPESTLSQIKIATVGDSDSLAAGQGVIAIGNALGYGQSTTVGYISALDREVQTQDTSTGEIITRNMIQVDAAINPGNSGGALLNMKGEVIGINAAKYASTEVEGVGYAIPITYAEDIIGDLMNRQTRIEVAEEEQGYLGIQGQNITQEMAQAFAMPRGVYVYKILEGGAAANSDLKEKDIITKIDGSTVKNMSDLQEMLTYFKGGTTVKLTVQSLVDGEYQEREVSVTLGYRADAEKLQQQNTEESKAQ